MPLHLLWKVERREGAQGRALQRVALIVAALACAINKIINLGVELVERIVAGVGVGAAS
jgi:hypothetical protein